jgi:hypothetical protein
MTIATTKLTITEHEAAQVERANASRTTPHCLRSRALAPALELGTLGQAV